MCIGELSTGFGFSFIVYGGFRSFLILFFLTVEDLPISYCIRVIKDLSPAFY